VTEHDQLHEVHEVQISNDTPITVNGLIKWGGILAAFVTSLISLIWFAAGTKSDINEIRLNLTTTNKETQLYEIANDKRCTVIEIKANETDKAVAQIESKLDVVVAILERIDKRTGGK
jgi:hypothetical protein